MWATQTLGFPFRRCGTLIASAPLGQAHAAAPQEGRIARIVDLCRLIRVFRLFESAPTPTSAGSKEQNTMATVLGSDDMEQLQEEVSRIIDRGAVDTTDVLEAIRRGDTLDMDDDLALDFSGTDLSDFVDEEVCIISGDYSRGLGTQTRYDAYRIGDVWCVRQANDDGPNEWVETFPVLEADARFQGITEWWLNENNIGSASWIDGVHRDEPWFIRAVTQQAKGFEDQFISSIHDDRTLSNPGKISRAVELWQRVVTADPDGVPPIDSPIEQAPEVEWPTRPADDSDAEDQADSILLEANPMRVWLAGHGVRWTEDGEELDEETAMRLRLVCLHLASV